MSALQECEKHAMGANLGHAVQIEPRVDLVPATRQLCAFAANDIWAVGFTDTAPSFVAQPLSEHFDGTSWTVVPSASLPSGAAAELQGVSTLSATDAWAVGEKITSNALGEVFYHTLIEQWNGANWSIVSSPNPSGSGYSQLNRVDATSTSNVWAIGYDTQTGSLVERFDGTRWTTVAPPRSTAAISSASRPKSAERIDGASWGVIR